MRDIKPNKKEDEALIASYKRVYKKNFFKNPINLVEQFFFTLLLSFHNFLSICIDSWSLKIEKRNKDKYKNRIAECSFANDFSKYDPNVNKLLTLEPKKERIYQTREVQNIACDIAASTKGLYGKDDFKWDLFGHLLKKKSNDLNTAEL